MIHRAMEMLENLEQYSVLWLVYECLLGIYSFVGAAIILFANIKMDNPLLDRFDWPEYFNILLTVGVPYALTLVIRLLAAIHYIIFGEEG